MPKNLVIVESPAKAKTIEKFLGKDYKVMSSFGHIRDLKKRDFSINTETFEPLYEIPTDKKKLVSELKTEAKKAEMVWLASDEDREGEAISWHLFEVLELDPEKTRRIVFHEITKNAILHAIETPRSIDINLVNAQQARRALDRIVGFKLSPVLWRRVKPALSAGRVQSVAVRLIVEREREIQQFVSEASYRINALFNIKDETGNNSELKAELDCRFTTRKEAEDFLQAANDAVFTIEDIVTKPLRKTPAPPFTTSTLQQEAARKLGFTVSQTMMVAQRLYESGHITYMRTDSVNLSSLAINTSREAIIEQMGEKYVKTRQFATKSKGAQEAHEAIRPTYMDKQTIEGTPQERRLYALIWKRTIASQMADAELKKTTANISISNRKEQFIATGEVITFDGFLRVYRESNDDEQETENEGMLPPLQKGEVVTLNEMNATERYSQHPLRYTEASLVKKLEELGIGRPSTYAPTISTIQQREYVEKGDKLGETRSIHTMTLKNGTITEENRTETTGNEKGKLLPTDIGTVVNDFLLQHFPQVMDYNFTASAEKNFDEIAEGDKEWTGMIKEFYNDFIPQVNNAVTIKDEHRVGERILGTDPVSGKSVSVKIGRFGPVAQIGTAEDAEKPRFAQMKKEQSLDSITLEEALELFQLPRTIGNYEETDVVIGTGRFGPYIQHKSKYVSIPKELDPLNVTLDEAINLINEKRQTEANRHIKTLGEGEEMIQILNGRFGPYIAYKGKNYKIPKETEPATLQAIHCLAIIEQQEKEGSTKKVTRKASTRKK